MPGPVTRSSSILTRTEVLLHPSPQTVERYRSDAREDRLLDPTELKQGSESVQTLDGVKIRLRANVELPAEFKGVNKYRAQGIGLYRSEFLLARPG